MQDLKKKCILIVALVQLNVSETWNTVQLLLQVIEPCVRVFAPVFYEQ